MSLSHTILGFLSLGPLTGYDLKKHIDNSTQLFWHAELSQIYPSLKNLEAKGLVIFDTVPQEGKPDKKIYAITPAGRQTLNDWLSEPLDETPPTKSLVLLKIFFLESLGKPQTLVQLTRQLGAQRARLNRYRQETRHQIEDYTQSSNPSQSGFLWELLRQYGELQTQTSIRWLEMVIQEMEKKI
ncbi:MAG: PadR family transcriptional regulator [Anaerolineaceae bacterium]